MWVGLLPGQSLGQSLVQSAELAPPALRRVPAVRRGRASSAARASASHVSTDMLNSHGIYVYNAHSGAALPMTAGECLQALRPNGMVTDCDYTGMDLRGFDLTRTKAPSSIHAGIGALRPHMYPRSTLYDIMLLG